MIAQTHLSKSVDRSSAADFIAEEGIDTYDWQERARSGSTHLDFGITEPGRMTLKTVDAAEKR